MIHDARLQLLNSQPVRRGKYVVYWMQQAQRASCNHALEYAIRSANDLGLPVLAVFGLTPDFPEANARHYRFMLEGLRETKAALAARGIELAVMLASPDEAATRLAEAAALLVTDRGYLRVQREWRARAAAMVPCQMVQVETDVVVPVEQASSKEEYAARTIRPRIQQLLLNYLRPLKETDVRRDSLGLTHGGIELTDLDAVIGRLGCDATVPAARGFAGGASQAEMLLGQFVRDRLERYHELRSDPSLDWVSHMSPYLHFGQISPLAIALEVAHHRGPGPDAYLEELVVRRELAMNFVHYNPRYDAYDSLPAWVRATLDRHRKDPREVLYTADELERAATHDPYWNAAQREMVVRGKMHNYMRMYWGKKVIEWSPTPEAAFDVMVYLNNRYELDGRDANSYAGIAWCFGKHDRPWAERPVFGTVRYMSASGLERKFDMQTYVRSTAWPAGWPPLSTGPSPE